MKPLLHALALLAALTASPALAIVGAAEDGAPFRDRIVMVLSQAGAAGGFCTGVPLAPRVVLTAAHCLKSAGRKGSRASSGPIVAVYRNDQGQPVGVPVVAVERHPAFHEDAIRRRLVSVDLALLELATPLPPRFRASEIAATAPSIGDAVVVAGFGLGREGESSTGGVARAAELRAAEPASEVTLWAEDPKRAGLGACAGDSGGPMFDAHDKLAAIVAWTNGTHGAKCGAITQGSLLPLRRAWIDAVMARWGS